MNPKISRRDASLFMLSMASGACIAQSFPSKPIKLVVGFSPGGGSDFVARALAQDMAPSLGQQVIVDNKAGAGGAIAARSVATADPDGYTLLLGSAANFVINPLLVKNLPYNVSDFVSVGAASRFNYALLVRKNLPVRSVAELVAYAKNSPDALTIGSAGNGSNTHLAAASFMAATGAKMRHIPYKGTSPALTDLMGGAIDVLFDSVPTVHGQIKSGALRALAVSGLERESVLPELPTIAELGWKQFSASNWFAVFAPKKTPSDVIDRLNTAIQKALATDRLRKLYGTSGNDPLPGTAADLAQLVIMETSAYRRLIQATAITYD